MEIDQQSIDDLIRFINDIRQTIQEAYSIAKIVDHLEELEQDPKSVRSSYYGYLRDCANCILLALNKYCLDFKPENPFDDEEGHCLRWVIDKL